MNNTVLSEEDVDMLIPAQVARQHEEGEISAVAGGEEISRPSPVYVEEGKMKIVTREMEEGIFYFVFYQGEEYAVRKLDENRVEFREVEE